MKKPKYRIADKVRLSTFTKGYYYCVPEKHEDFKGPGLLGAIKTIRDIRITDDGDVWYTFMDYDNWVTEDAIEALIHPSMLQFVVGKWYTCEGMCGKLTSYPEPPKFPSTEWIDEKGQYHDTGTFFLWTPENIEEADMSEVSKYLPYGHPDKIVETAGYKKGNWYKYPNWVEGSYIKFDRIAHNRVYFTESIRNEKYEHQHDWWGYLDTGTLGKVHIKEILRYLPDGHPDKVAHYVSYAPTTLVKNHNDLPTSISLSRMYESIYGKDSQTTSPKTKNEHVIHQSPVLIGKKKPFKQLFIINN